ncbi:MAG: pilus assembly protein TadG-related protein [Hyphomicrobiales bacterium]
MATTAAVAALPLVFAAGMAVDYTSLTGTRAKLQNAVDAAALASARQLGLAGSSDESIRSYAKNVVIANISSTNKNTANGEDLALDAIISDERTDVTINLTYQWEPLVLQHITKDVKSVAVSATATLTSKANLCVLALETTNDRAIDLGGRDGHITANDCIIHSNSTGENSISVIQAASLEGETVITAGGFDGPLNSFQPIPVTDGPVIEDPLLQKTPPVVGSCDFNNFSAQKSNSTLNPGVYCGGLYIGPNLTANLAPGEYIIKDGPLVVQGNGAIIGEDVSFYFTGDSATFDFDRNTRIALSARESGPLSGVLFFEDRTSPLYRSFTIRSQDAEKFEGVTYLPNGTLFIDGRSRVGQQSNWTAIVARRITIGSGPDIVINSDFASSTIPAPEGIAGGNGLLLKN